MTQSSTAGKVISTILRHDRKVTSYKLALLRAINDLALAYPGLEGRGTDVAVPLHQLARRWIAYYWLFCDKASPILQGQRRQHSGGYTQDLDFRPHITKLREEWEKVLGGPSHPADGFFLLTEMETSRRRSCYPQELVEAFTTAVKAVTNTLLMPIRYAGPPGEEWSIFPRPVALSHLTTPVTALPGTLPTDRCLVIPCHLWEGFCELSLWVEALCVHEWCLFTEKLPQSAVTRGAVYQLLTSRPDNRRPLSWERHQVDLLILEGQEFSCPWTGKTIRSGVGYDLDHLLPVAVYPINELWNLAPSDPYFNSHIKRDRLAGEEKLVLALPRLVRTYTNYLGLAPLAMALKEESSARFLMSEAGTGFPEVLAEEAARFIRQVARNRNLATF